MAEGKKFAASLSARPDWREAVSEAASAAAAQLGDASCDLTLLFVADLYAGIEPEKIQEAVASSLPGGQLVALNASGVLGGSREVEFAPSVSILAMSLPGVKIKPFHLSASELSRMENPAALVAELDIYPTDDPGFLLFADPLSLDIEGFMRLFNAAYPGLPAIGGLASGASVGKPSWLVLNGEAFPQGALGVSLTGDVSFEIAVAQGCRPVGKPWTVTRAEGTSLYQLGAKTAVETLKETLEEMSADEKALARQALFAGLLMDEKRGQSRSGDFLIRNIIGFDPPSGALALGAEPRVGQTFQFQIRDAKTSARDLEECLESLRLDKDKPRGAFLASCCGRGRALYGRPNHDSSLIQRILGPLPLAGFFANGEIGPVSGNNYVHGYTSSLALIS